MSSDINILFSSPSISRIYTGVTEVQKNVALELLKLNINVDIVSLVDAYTKEDIVDWGALKPEMHRKLFPQLGDYSRTYFDALLNSSGNVGHIHALWSYSSWALYKWSKITQNPYLLSANGYLDPWSMNNSKLKKKAALAFGFRSVLESAGCIQVNSSNEIDSVRGLNLSNPMCLISNGVVLPDLGKRQTPPWSHYKPIHGKKILLYLGRIDKKKGVDLLIDAWKTISVKDKKDWHLILVGFDDTKSGYQSYIKAKISEDLLEDSVLCLDGQYGLDMEACYRNCDAFILPSYSEGASISVLNAWAFSKPAIITEGCGFVEGFSFGSAVKINPDIGDIVMGIMEIIRMSDAEREEMGFKGRVLVEKNYSWEIVTKSLLDVYNWMHSKDYAKPNCIV